MPALTLEYRGESERLALERALASVTHLRQVARAAPEGSALAACEPLAPQEGRALLRTTLTAALEGRIAVEGQKGGRAAVPAGAPRPLQGAP
jgi:hypothetical protein